MEKNEVERHIQDRKKKRNFETATDEPSDKQAVKKQRQFRQNRPISRLHGEEGAKLDSSVLRSILAPRDVKKHSP